MSDLVEAWVTVISGARNAKTPEERAFWLKRFDRMQEADAEMRFWKEEVKWALKSK